MLAADGERVPIEDISPGDEVVATDPETGERVTRMVDASWSHVDETVTISIDDRELVTTEDHRFWSQTVGAFVPAGDLEVGDKVVGDRGRVHTVTRTAEVGGYERVWNLSIDQVHTYHVGDTDTLVHNTCPTIGARLRAAGTEGLLRRGPIRFIPHKGYNPANRLPTKKIGENVEGYVDRFGNVWVQGPSRDPRFTHEWDVQLAEKSYKWFGKKAHINVSPDGYITH